MTKILYCILYVIIFLKNIHAQVPTVENFGVRHLSFIYKNNNVDIIIQSKPGDELVSKPLFFFCQGSLPQPLLKYGKEGLYGVFPFDTRNIIENCHIVIVGKPGIPIIANANSLSTNFTYIDSLQQFPKKYLENNYLEFYVQRNMAVITFLMKKNWVQKNKLVMAGHSEGSTIAVQLAYKNSKITHLIYSGGNPMGRITSMLQQSRFYESDSTKKYDKTISYWEQTLAEKHNLEATTSDSYKTTFSFSKPQLNYLLKLKIPVLVSYGTKDWSSVYNDYLQVNCITNNKKNFKFLSYIDCEHNYFPVNKKMETNFTVFNWDKVADNWLNWLKKNN